MIYKEHYLEILVNGKRLEINQKDINLRFQNELYNPEKISSTQAEYSFELSIPSTPANDKIFDYANNLSKLNKFRTRFNAEVYADGTLIFEGSLTLNGYKDKEYKCNLVSIKVYSLEDIFGDTTLYDISGTKDDPKWYVPFEGIASINEINAMSSTDVTFPLISYGAFQKADDTTKSDSTSKSYTSKFDLDKYNRWYVESFSPSLRMLETLRKCFEYKDKIVIGDVFNDNRLNNIYMSTNLADGQAPTYNLGHPNFGVVDLNVSLTTSGTGYQQELQFPYFAVSGLSREEVSQGVSSVSDYNFKSINLYNFLAEGTVTMVNPNRPSYMYQPNEHLIVIPADGFYKIELTATSSLNTTSPFSATTHLINVGNKEMYDEDIQITPSFLENTPLEIHLVRNYSDNIELIKGRQNIQYVDGNPNHTMYSDSTGWHSNIRQWVTDFPHEDPYNAALPTKVNDLSLKNTSSQWGGNRATAGKSVDERSTIGGSRTNPSTRAGGSTTSEDRDYSRSTLGYMQNMGEIMCYDPAVSDTFICGMSSLYYGYPSVIKNGYSWSTSYAEKMESFYKQAGYLYVTKSGDTLNYERTSKYENSYYNAPDSSVNSTANSMNGKIYCIVYLYKNDILQLYAVQRSYENYYGDVNYSTTTNAHLKITAFSPKSYDILYANSQNDYNLESQFDYDLRLSNFLNKEKKVSEWVQNIADAFNFEITQYGNTVEINKKKKLNRDIPTAVDIDNRVNSADAESSRIDYPASMAVKYKIDTDEWGAEKSVIEKYGQSAMNESDWQKYIDSGYTVIPLNDDTYVTNKSEKTLQFSYTWYDNFYYFGDSERQIENDPLATLRIPVISKYTYMIDGYNYEESMKHDGYGLAQRFWYKPVQNSGVTVSSNTYPVEVVNIYSTSNLYDGLNLSYKTTEDSLLQFFNITPYLASNYVEVEAYLSPEEYKMIKNGAMIHFDNDLYYPVSIEGFDPGGNNPTTLKIMKKL